MAVDWAAPTDEEMAFVRHELVPAWLAHLDVVLPGAPWCDEELAAVLLADVDTISTSDLDDVMARLSRELHGDMERRADARSAWATMNELWYLTAAFCGRASLPNVSLGSFCGRVAPVLAGTVTGLVCRLVSGGVPLAAARRTAEAALARTLDEVGAAGTVDT